MSRSAVAHDNPFQWSAPAGWVQTASGVWSPPDYRATRWEIQAPAIFGDHDARIDWIKCSKSLPYFAFAHCWTLDTDDPSGVSVRKIPAYPYLRRFFEEVQEPCNVHVEKSRQMLMSWAWMVVITWDVLFHKRFNDLIISKRSTDVDDGGVNATPNSNFGKIKFIVDHLSQHLWQRFEFKKFMIRVPAMHSSVKGETGKGGMAARGPTHNRALCDEAAYIERSETVFKGIRQAAKNGTALNSTPNGKTNVFYRIKASPTTTFKKLSFHWSEHPRKAIGLYCICGWKARPGEGGLTARAQYFIHKDACPRIFEQPPRQPQMRSPWYDAQAQDLTEEQLASELDISYEKSQRGRVYWKFDQARNVWPILDELGPRRVDETLEEYQRRYLQYVIDPELQPFVAWDFGISDSTAMLFGQIVNDDIPIIRFLDEVENNQQSYDFYGRIVESVWMPALRAARNPRAILHYGDPYGKHRESDLESWLSNLKREFGIIIGIEGSGGILEWCDYINDQYGRGNIQIADWCAGLIDAVQSYHYQTDDKGNPIPGKTEPVHDESSHKCDAKRYLYKMRYTPKLTERKSKGIPIKRLLGRGGGINHRDETRIF